MTRHSPSRPLFLDSLARSGLLRDLLGGALILTIWLVLWSWFFVALTGNAARPSFLPPGHSVSERV